MKLRLVLLVVVLLLSTNYLCGWTYEKGGENRLEINDSVTVCASHFYNDVTPLKYLFLGKNYREVWATPVKMRVFHLRNFKGGLEIEKMGGGQQTKSLHLEDKNGVKYVLRTVDKDVAPALPKVIRKTFIKSIVQDQVSAAYPYAPLTISTLAQSMGVPADSSILFFVPDDPALGNYRPFFANTVCFFKKKNLTPDGSKTFDTDEVREMFASSTQYRIMEEKVLRARLLDMLIGDWDRHDRQWEWGIKDSMGLKFVYPLPEDRDQAFFLTDGLLPKIIRQVGMPHLVGFRFSLDHVKQLNHKANYFDHYFMSALTASDWRRNIREVQNALSDKVIADAIKNLPPEVIPESGREIEQKLKSRRDELEQYGMEYYRFLADEAFVFLTKEPERINIFQEGESVQVRVENNAGEAMYERLFLKKETDEIHFKNYGKEDVLKISGTEKPAIEIIYEERKPAP